MIKGTYYEALNARFLTFEEVAKKFVPLRSFSRLIRDGHSVLMGPRGCGKTTLLKMLTRRALRAWHESKRSKLYPESFPIPGYESIYIPSDQRWFAEINGVTKTRVDLSITQQTQRVMLSTAVIDAVLGVFKAIIEDIPIPGIERRKYEVDICNSVIDLCQLNQTIPSFRDVTNKIVDIMVNVRAGVNSCDSQQLKDLLGSIPPILYAGSLDPAIQLCRRASHFLPVDIRPVKWAICFDELEIAPQWLQTELLRSLRSIDQDFFLKLTWSPILPKAETMPEPGADFAVIRLWNSHVQDPIEFCENIASSFLTEKFPKLAITPDQFLGYSIIATSQGRQDEQEYRRGTTVYNAFRAMAARDQSLSRLMGKYGVDPDDPIPSSDSAVREKQMDEFFRKAKPIVLLRDAFLKQGGAKRTRKKVQLYSGKQAVYAVSEGNPRWLLGLLNDLCDTMDWSGRVSVNEYRIPASKQALVLNAASRRFMALAKAIPVAGPYGSQVGGMSLVELIESLAVVFSEYLYGDEFHLDPVMSFRIGEEIPKPTEAAMRRALELGALVHVGTSRMDVPSQIAGERFRLSFMICPRYKLPLRNYRELRLKARGIQYKDPHGRAGDPIPRFEQLPLEFENK